VNRFSGWRGLPLPAWAGLLGAAGVAAVVGVVMVVLALEGRLDGAAGRALAAGALAGLGVSLVAAAAAGRLGRALRALRAEAAHRLQEPSAPVVRPGVRPLSTRLSTEITDLARLLDALHLRVRMADEVGARRQRDAQTVGAGVYELLSGLVAAEEGARGQLSAELHDTVAQSLMLARSVLGEGPPSQQQLVRLSDHLEDAEEQVRAVMARTRPPALLDGDLASAVAGLRADMAARYGLQVHLSWPAEPHPLPVAAAITLYRFFQEALLNVVKHADVEDAELGLTVLEDAVLGTVQDAGPGFDPDAVRPVGGRHVGLGLLRERARLSGGSLQVVSGDRGGTLLTIRLPRAAQVPPGQAGVEAGERQVGTSPG
jgi:signal transduction histidine kinase